MTTSVAANPAIQQDTSAGRVISIFAVVVVYKMLPSDSPTVRTLLRAASIAPVSELRLHVRVVDNTPGGQDPGRLPAGVEYCAFAANPGLSQPYNEAWRDAAGQQYAWLLTLDQDTELPETFLISLVQAVHRYGHDDAVAAIVPKILDHGRMISPLRFLGGFLPVVVPAGTSGLLGRHALALNSCSLLRISGLQAVGGYDEAFPLHNSDTVLYGKLDRAGKRVVLADGIVVSHELAIMDRAGRMSGDRYRSMLADERVYWDLHMGSLGRGERLVRLVGRVAKDLVRGQRSEFTSITAREIALRLLTRRRARLVAFRTGARSQAA